MGAHGNLGNNGAPEAATQRQTVGGGPHDQRAPRKLDNALRHAHWRRPLLRLALLLLLGGGGHGAARLKRAQAALHRQRPRRKRVCRHEEAGGL